MPSGKRWYAVLLAIAICAAFALSARLLRREVRRFNYYAGPLTEARYRELASRPGWQANVLDVGGGVMLRGLERDPKDPRAPWVLFFAPNSGSLLEDSQRFLDGLIGELDWGAIVWAYRGFDGSDGSPSPPALANDAWQQYRTLLDVKSIGHQRVHFVSFSLGTSIAATVAARAQDVSPASVTWIAPLVDVDVFPPHQYVGAHRYSTLASIDALRGPVLIVHGSSDAQLPVDGGRLLSARLGARARYVELPGLGHLEAFRAPATQAIVRDFIVAHIR